MPGPQTRRKTRRLDQDIGRGSDSTSTTCKKRRQIAETPGSEADIDAKPSKSPRKRLNVIASDSDTPLAVAKATIIPASKPHEVIEISDSEDDMLIDKPEVLLYS